MIIEGKQIKTVGIILDAECVVIDQDSNILFRTAKRKDGRVYAVDIIQCEEYIKTLGLSRDFIHFKSELEAAE